MLKLSLLGAVAALVVALAVPTACRTRRIGSSSWTTSPSSPASSDLCDTPVFISFNGTLHIILRTDKKGVLHETDAFQKWALDTSAPTSAPLLVQLGPGFFEYLDGVPASIGDPSVVRSWVLTATSRTPRHRRAYRRRRRCDRHHAEGPDRRHERALSSRRSETTKTQRSYVLRSALLSPASHQDRGGPRGRPRSNNPHRAHARPRAQGPRATWSFPGRGIPSPGPGALFSKPRSGRFTFATQLVANCTGRCAGTNQPGEVVSASEQTGRDGGRAACPPWGEAGCLARP